MHRFSNLSDFFCEFSVNRTRRPRGGNGESTVVHLPHQKFCLRFFLSSIPRHRSLCSTLATSVLTLIPGDPSTRVVTFFLFTCRKCFSSRREKGSPSRRIEVCFSLRFSFTLFFLQLFLFSFLFFFFGGEHLAGSVGYIGTCKRGRATSRAWEVGALKDGLRVHGARDSFLAFSST